jgi:WD40 repeat protein
MVLATIGLGGLFMVALAFAVSYLFSMIGDASMVTRKATLKGTDRHFYALGFSPDGKLLAAGQQDGTVKIWDTATFSDWLTIAGTPVHVANFSATVSTLAFSPDSKVLAWGGGEAKVFLLDLPKKEMREPSEAQQAMITELAFFPGGGFLALGDERGVVRYWKLERGQGQVVFDETKSEHYRRILPTIHSIAFHPGGTTLAVAINGSLIFLRANDAKEQGAVATADVVGGLTFSRDGKALAGYTSSQDVKLWDAVAMKETGVVTSFGGESAASLAFSPAAPQLLAIALGHIVGRPSYVEIWDVVQGKKLTRFACHDGAVFRVAWSPDGQTLATCGNDSADNSVNVWDVSAVVGKK